MRIEIDRLTTQTFLMLYRSVGWEPPCEAQVKAALANTWATFTAYEEEQAIGMVRLLGDGGMSFCLKDFAVLPSAQSRGVGRRLIEAVEQYIREHLPKEWAVSLELISTKEAVPFYLQMGFEERPCEWDGPGMFKMLRP